MPQIVLWENPSMNIPCGKGTAKKHGTTKNMAAQKTWQRKKLGTAKNLATQKTWHCNKLGSAKGIAAKGRTAHMGKMTVYHGSYTAVKKPKIISGKNTKDFGYGFYCTIIREQAERWARRYDNGIINTYTVRLDTSLKILEFREMTESWLDFIIACRGGRPHDYDIVIGAMANDQIFNYIADYIDGIITREQFWSMARFKYPTHQISFCSPAALKCLEFVSCEEVLK